MTTIRAILKPDGKVYEILPDGTERELPPHPIPRKTEEEIYAAALADPDNPPAFEGDGRRMHPVAKSKVVRNKLGLGREEFADRYRIPLDVITAWERYKAEPDAVACAYLDAIAGNPEAVEQALGAPLKAAE